MKKDYRDSIKENDIQKAVAYQMDIWERAANSFLWWHTPNGELRHPKVGAELKKMGTKSGIPDIIVLHKGGIIFIELKTSTGRMEPSQEEFKDDVEAMGHTYYLVKTSDPNLAVAVIRSHLKNHGVI
ncbi:MAG: hypothetical protein CMP22_07730 [Rickettsiales bacterium]|nr:hypothetical protein [Rickettsiales bacterium]|tara:strand:- start:94 stop:474 length:381 start_codon:yes stop_codon:yes gene_type:complete